LTRREFIIALARNLETSTWQIIEIASIIIHMARILMVVVVAMTIGKPDLSNANSGVLLQNSYNYDAIS